MKATVDNVVMLGMHQWSWVLLLLLMDKGFVANVNLCGESGHMKRDFPKAKGKGK